MWYNRIFFCDVETNFRYGGSEFEFTPAEVIEKLNGMIAQIVKKNSAPKKPSATQLANEALQNCLLIEMEVDTDYTVTQVIKACPSAYCLTNQKVTAMLNAMTAEGKLTKNYIKGVPYFRVVVNEVEGE